ncbi:hypothetical protein [Roseiflexus castenholzii]|uniref:hypothetical protein n=1 Tax=Roseiflexus castenholzii TaxID=120962 RepID=UPI00059D6A34|nr:hypothetical protein [Roseiflexus castenholzii]
MQTVTVPEIVEHLQRLSPEKLVVVYDFVSYLLERETGQTLSRTASEAFQPMLASEPVLRRDWERPEEDLAWANL